MSDNKVIILNAGNLEELVGSVFQCHVLGVPYDGTLQLSPQLKEGCIYIGKVDGVSILLDKKLSVTLHSITYSRQQKESKTKDKQHRITFYPPGAYFPIEKMHKNELSFEEAAGVIGVTLRHLFRLIAKGKFKPKKKGRRKYLSCKDVLQWIIKRERNSKAPYLIGGE